MKKIIYFIGVIIIGVIVGVISGLLVFYLCRGLVVVPYELGLLFTGGAAMLGFRLVVDLLDS